MPFTENYRNDPVVAYEGMIADTGAATILSGTADADIEFGKPVVIGTADGKVTNAPTTGTPVILGVAARLHSPDLDSGGNENEYPKDSNVSYVQEGAVWVEVGEDVADGSFVEWHVASAEFQAGTGATATSGTVRVGNGSYYETSATDGNLARIRLR